MLIIADQVELIGPVQPFKIAQDILHLHKDQKSFKTGEDSDYVYFDRYALFIGAIGIVARISRDKVMVLWTHYMPGLKPPNCWIHYKGFELLHRPEYPQPQNFYGKEEIGTPRAPVTG